MERSEIREQTTGRPRIALRSIRATPLSIGQTIGAARANANNRNGLASNRDDERACSPHERSDMRVRYVRKPVPDIASLIRATPPGLSGCRINLNRRHQA